ncbi:hypothetical protein FRC08_007034 [Ceratobasidium sp. 394]|nr:hypothetical protein FRC08_007034 [Ceratobasidium sp. 394]
MLDCFFCLDHRVSPFDSNNLADGGINSTKYHTRPDGRLQISWAMAVISYLLIDPQNTFLAAAHVQSIEWSYLKSACWPYLVCFGDVLTTSLLHRLTDSPPFVLQLHL